jgi:hypothetical protein
MKGAKMTNRQKILTSISVLAFATYMAGSAQAGTLDYNYDEAIAADPTTSVNVSNFVLGAPSNDQLLPAPVSALVNAVNTNITYTGTATPQTNTLGHMSTLAIGNTVFNASIIGGEAGANESTGSLSAQTVYNSSVRAVTSNADIFIDLTDYQSGAITLTYNDILATTSVNKNVSQIVGPVPNDLSSTTAGQVSASLDTTSVATNEVDATGTTSIGVAQVNFNSGPIGVSGSVASIDDSDIYLTIDADAGIPGASQILSSTPSFTHNNIAAQYTGNQTASLLSPISGDSTNYTGSANIVSTQINYADGAGTGNAASVTDSQITTTIQSTGALGADHTILTGDLAMTNNAISATAIGNDAASKVPSYFGDPDYAPNKDVDGSSWQGNQIAFGSGINVIGTGAASDSDLDAFVIGDDIGGALKADLAVLNVQGNINTEMSSLVQDGEVSALVEIIGLADGTNPGTVTLSENSIGTVAVGSQAVGAISADSSLVAATAATGNVQVNDGTNILSQNNSPRIGVTVNLGSDIFGGSALTVSDNEVTSGAAGNIYDASIDLDATALTTPGGPNEASADFDRTGAAISTDTQGGITMANLQANAAETGDVNIYSGVVGANIEITESVPAFPNTDVTDATLTVSGNKATASAVGNDSNQQLELSGTNAGIGASVLTAAVSNSQSNVEGDFDVTVESEVEDLTILILADDVDPSVVNITGNEATSTTIGNTANNGISVDYTNLEIGAAAAQIPGDNIIDVDTGGADHNAEAAFVVANDQFQDGDTNADVEDFLTSIDVDSSTDSKGNIADNLFGALAYGNEAENSLSLTATNLTTASGDLDAVGAVSNVQVFVSDIFTEVDGEISFINHDAIAGSTVTVSDNTRESLTIGNVSDNSLTASGTNHQYVASAALDGVRLTGGDHTLIEAAFGVSNYQNAGGTVESDTSGDTFVEVGTGPAFVNEDLDNTTITLSGNNSTAETRVHAAQSELSLDFTNLTTSGGVANLQLYDNNAADVSADVSGNVYVDLSDNVNNGTFTLSDNDASATSVVASAENTLNLKAVNLAGGAEQVTTSVETDTADFPEGFFYDNTTDYAIGSAQDTNANVIEAVAARNVYVVMGNTAVDGVDGALVTITDNDVSAWAQTHSADNLLDIDAVNAVDLSAGIANLQEDTSTQVLASTTVNFGLDTFGGNAGVTLEGINATVSENTGTARALGNAASNVLNADVSGALLGAGTEGEGTVDAPSDTLSAQADFAVLNRQYSDLADGAVAGVVYDNIGYDQQIIDEDNDNIGSIFTISNNSLVAVSDVNLATNKIALEATSELSTSASVVSQQQNFSNAFALVTGVNQNTTFLGVRGNDMDDTPITVTGNTLAALAHANTASNSVSASSALIGGDGEIALATRDTTGTTDANVQADYSVLNYQVQDSSDHQPGINVSARLVVSRLVGASADALTDSNVTVSDNTLLAIAGANTAENLVELQGAAIEATGAIASVQTSNANVNAAISGFPDFDFNIGVVMDNDEVADEVSANSDLTVSGNYVSADATGNQVSNELYADASTSFNLNTGGTLAGETATGNIAQADYAVLNLQDNSGGISASVTGGNIGVGVFDLPSDAEDITGSSLTVLNNQVYANATGNVADNIIGLSNLPGDDATAALTNNQTNTGAGIIASVSGVNIGINAGQAGGGSTATNTVSGNSIGASAIGNAARNVIGNLP